MSDFKGKWLLLYFYPRDFTPGCTAEACDFRDELYVLNGLKLQVVGVSTDSVESHIKFSKKHNLKFPLLADPEKKVVTLYNVWGPKKFMGREYLGTKRTSFLIDPKGKITKIYEKVNPAKHTTEVINDLQKYSNQNLSSSTTI